VADIQGGTTAEGIHLGAVAGTVDLMQRCYTGVETRGDILRFDPQLPKDLNNIELNLIYRRNWLNVQIDHTRLLISSKRYAAVPIEIGLKDQVIELKPGDSVELKI
jgi:alpha,alpha-trehalase